ncbi:DeoR/GlpR family DNA-binding transcription regulator [Streptococcus dysgalactiae]|uniref:DeoR/GlpR family DNA-binding transcription regulator n=1 Tax=Streptococcus dysgalactiae TaxID=1334 RepID=UPI000E064CC2|nr:DeoR/GlpR family DNA-binding transcription regulator [Streptococcus dysgalactiae]MCB2829232.1 DeoR/GlpR family DNA-binding transcription regulator [Streptococcus dysgalactiae subsp. dysgalactiae]MCB2831601.1 DeoR/GlpR family DNA-binding transcription regulator [Streptococcus dysgalactiae subsp. dysgalactiae]MCB2835308.1 DeoR/GlpR family DNA-binding transcription regulator [Streptococcus dysgalactiae subsp. dysgalactiae]MCB2837525.1 DeoR/GlpR family DNA-binding transcription regulator [Strept
MAKIVKDNYVALEDLMQLLDSSESTVRRDLGELEQEGRLHRVHGGAELFHSLQEELSNQEKSVKNSQIKQALAQKASRFIYDNDVIFIDAGTTTEFLLPFLQGKNVTVVTNSIHHATRLVDLSIKTIIIGGYVKQTTDASIGSVALEQIRQMNFDKAFLGMNGVDEAYLTTPDMEEAVIKKAVIANAKVSYILVDGSKIGQVSFVKVAAINQVTIITEAASTGILKKIKEKAKVVEL